ncbi:miraculin [Capsicum chacoense]
MKRLVLLISLAHLVLSFPSSCSSAATTPNQLLQVVRDINGDIVKSNARYFLMSSVRGVDGFGGVRRGPTINGAGNANFVCPFQVVQSPRDLDRGMPVIFKPKAGKQVEITESTDVNIEFYLDNPTAKCNNTVWEVEGFPGHYYPMFLSTNGKAGNPSELATWFQIKKADSSSYKLVFCPFGGSLLCNDIGIQVVDEQRRLAASADHPFNFVFIKDPYIGINSII